MGVGDNVQPWCLADVIWVQRSLRNRTGVTVQTMKAS